MKKQLVLALTLAFFAAGTLAQSWAQSAAPGWDRLVADAKKEGKVVIIAPSDPQVREAIPAAFKAKYGITVEYLGGRSSDMAARLRTERASGIYTIDVALSGTLTMASIFHSEKMLDPLRPALIDPEVTDGSKWKAGKLWFIDPEDKYILRIFNTRTPMFYLNTNYVKPEEIQTAQDLLNPKFQGKIVTSDPTLPGIGSSDSARFYIQYGEDFVKKLYIDQKTVLSRDRRQIGDGVARGAWPIAMGAEDEEMVKLQKEGFPIHRVYSLKGMSDIVSPSEGHVGLFNNAPHPNAARLFVNWIASKEGLEIYARNRGCSPTRNDIDEASFLDPEMIAKSGVDYFDSYNWEFVLNTKEKIRLRVKEMLGK
ncbi:MAG TPA: extracellular solute-binding protein [Xanthobacteraceae bacterium]|nr:extracellular solute-binding protein [Xanthobacteraceae bacterium]